MFPKLYYIDLVEGYSGSMSNEDEDELPMKRHDLHQSQSNLHCTISFFVLFLLYHFICKMKIGNRIVKDPDEVAENCMTLYKIVPIFSCRLL